MSPDKPSLKVGRENWPSTNGHGATRVVRVGNLEIGGGRPCFIAGPCAVESRRQTLEIACQVRDAGADMLRGGAFKPRTSPYSYQGLGEEGLEILAEAREVTGLPVVTEVMDPRLVELVAQYADVIQIGSRNMHNYPILLEAGKAGKPVLLKRGWSATLEEWIYAAEYVAHEGMLDIILCERGLRTFSQGEYNRNTIDLNVVPAVRERTFLPVIVDPSHATGRAALVPPLTKASLAVGADGVIIEVIATATDRGKVLCDGEQSIRPEELRRIIAETRGASDTDAPVRKSRAPRRRVTVPRR
jgi:3-deoxy-7-phosphoheptulonate synthase